MHMALSAQRRACWRYHVSYSFWEELVEQLDVRTNESSRYEAVSTLSGGYILGKTHGKARQ